MNTRFVVLLFLLASQVTSYAHNLIKPDAKSRKLYESLFSLYSDALEVKNIFPEDDYASVEDYENNLFSMLEESVDTDQAMLNPYCELRQKTGITISRSEDKRIRVFSWQRPDNKYSCIIQYRIPPNRSRIISNGANYLSYPLEELSHFLIHDVKHLENGIYLLKGKSDQATLLLGIDVGTNRLYKSYVFNSPEDKPFAAYVSFTDDPDLVDEMDFIIDGRKASMPVIDSENNFLNSWQELYFNGSFFVDQETYDGYQKYNYELITRLTFRDEYRAPISTMYPGQSWTLIANKATNGVDFSTRDRDTIRLEDDELDISYKFMFKYINAAMTIENMDFYDLIKTDSLYGNPHKEGLPDVILVCGNNEALSYEWLTYSAMNFDKKIEPDQLDLIHWAVAVDEVVENLDPSVYFGNQIYLQMREEWESKAIRIIAYIGSMKPDFYKETRVYKNLEDARRYYHED